MTTMDGASGWISWIGDLVHMMIDSSDHEKIGQRIVHTVWIHSQELRSLAVMLLAFTSMSDVHKVNV